MKQTESDCPEAYLTFMRTVGSYKTNFANGISYDDYKDSYCLFGFDLSGSGECYLTNFVPLARAGILTSKSIRIAYLNFNNKFYFNRSL